MFKKNILCLSICCFVLGCGNESVEEMNSGQIINNVFTNDYFNMKITLPKNWAIQNEAAEKDLMEKGSELIAGDNKNLKSQVKASIKQIVNMFTLFQYEQGAPVTFNPSIICMGENVKHQPGIKKGKDYHFHSRKLLESGQMQYEFPNEIYTKFISGKDFDVMPLQLTINSLNIKQLYYATRIKDYMLLFILTFNTEAEEKSLNDVLDTLIFTDKKP